MLMQISQSDPTMGKVCGLHASNLGSIPSSPRISSSCTQSDPWTQNKESNIAPLSVGKTPNIKQRITRFLPPPSICYFLDIQGVDKTALNKIIFNHSWRNLKAFSFSTNTKHESWCVGFWNLTRCVRWYQPYYHVSYLAKQHWRKAKSLSWFQSRSERKKKRNTS